MNVVRERLPAAVEWKSECMVMKWLLDPLASVPLSSLDSFFFVVIVCGTCAPPFWLRRLFNCVTYLPTVLFNA